MDGQAQAAGYGQGARAAGVRPAKWGPTALVNRMDAGLRRRHGSKTTSCTLALAPWTGEAQLKRIRAEHPYLSREFPYGRCFFAFLKICRRFIYISKQKWKKTNKQVFQILYKARAILCLCLF